jgi:tetratricopeptide (TPR) repeat protein
MEKLNFAQTVLKRTVSIIILGFISCSNPTDKLAEAEKAYKDRKWQEVIDLLKDFPPNHRSADEAKYLLGKANCMLDNYDEAFSIFQKVDSSSSYFDESMEFIKISAKTFIAQSHYSKAIEALNLIPARSIHYKEAQELVFETEEKIREQKAREDMLRRVENSLSITNYSVYTVPIKDPISWKRSSTRSMMFMQVLRLTMPVNAI